ncbi:MAG: hypothetical protein NUV87_02045 [Candidatus Roizmanbacteria bacterium]|nr:hypothetical protein [Candidatus Roizmanbacteria bacterium]MCR4312703.1 hypothetical protein [Candidatus Roizmanbacteria bacterium]
MIANSVPSVLIDLLIIFSIIKALETIGKKDLGLLTKYWAFFLYLIAVFRGIGIPYFLLVFVGIIFTVLNINLRLLIILLLTLTVFLLNFFGFIFYPLLAVLASVGMIYLIDYKIKINGKYLTYPKIFSYIFIIISVVILILSSRIFFFKLF